ncbi:hypothetical protein ILUMI_09740, partial [Ignelater luminosus]
EVSHLASSLYTTGTNLSRSVSSAGEHQSEAYISPILPKRAETFGGFDNPVQSGIKLLGKKLQSSGGTPTLSPDMENLKPGDSKLFEKLPWRNCQITIGPTLTNGNTPMTDLQQSCAPPDIPALLSLGKEQQYAAVQLSHYVYTLLCIISQLMTSNESLQAHLITIKGGADSGKYRHNQQLEELRNLQDKLSAEKTAWAMVREQEGKELEDKRAELLKLQEQIRAEQIDITQQREQLYRKMEILTNQGLLISPNVALPVTGQLEDSSNQSSEESSPSQSEGSLGACSGSNPHLTGTERRKDSKWTKGTSKSQLPQHLISATNQQKVSQNVQVKQQLPLKLASRLSSGSSSSNTSTTTVPSSASGPQQMLPLKLSQDEKVRRTSTTGYQRLGSGSRSPTSGESTPTTPHSHSRTGSSPAMMQASSPAGGTPTSGQPPSNIPNSKASRTHTYPKLPDKFKVRNEQQSPADEEVIYF